MSDAAMEDWISRARESAPLEVAQALGAKLKRAGSAEHIGPCPACGGTDRFSINTKDRVFNCRGSGGGDVITMAAHILGLDAKKDFIAVCESILQEPPPRGESRSIEPDPAIQKERKEERRDAAIERDRQDSAKLLEHIERATSLFEKGMPIEGTIVQDYLERRGINYAHFPHADLRFIPNLSYRGFANPPGARDENGDELPDEEVELGRFHCMVAAARDARGRITGVHRTYIDPSAPIKLRAPGDRTRNKAKKGTFQMGGGLIMLQPPTDLLAVGEGIETSLAWLEMARIGEFGDDFAHAGAAAAYSLGNLCGKAAGTIPHPNPPRGRRNATLPNDDPDLSSPAIWIPKGVKRLVLLGDGDSEPAWTRAMLRLGGQRFRRLGLDVFVHFAPDGSDWNDVLFASRRLEAA
ncbi:MAG: hypothetical protein KGZ68_10965 [Dechloromonas sp.]|nr:hypothetical protein [Dechloromonas sp.]